MEQDLTTTDIVMVTFMILVVSLIIGMLIYFHYRARKMVFDWAERNKYRVLKLRFRHFFKGPFEWNSSRKRQKVFYVVIADDSNEVKKAFVKCGHFWKGLTVDQVEVKWEDMS